MIINKEEYLLTGSTQSNPLLEEKFTQTLGGIRAGLIVLTGIDTQNKPHEFSIEVRDFMNKIIVKKPGEPEEAIPFKGNYWWDDTDNVTSVLQQKLKEIMGIIHQMVSIRITGVDFNDGRERREATLEVKAKIGKIVCTKNYA